MSDTLNIFNRRHVAYDLETLSSRPNAAILSIGAVSFTFENGIDREFYINVDPISCIKRGLHVDKNTVTWWKNQPKEVSDLWKVDPQPLDDALLKLNDFIGIDKRQLVWCQGGSFDHPVLESARISCDIPRVYQYWQEMDTRTIFTLMGIRNDKIRKEETGYHSALGDAISQTNTLINLFK